jgi:Polyphosphate kinase 2 (PPK2)
MPRKEILDRIQKYTQPFRVTKGEAFQLKKHDPGETCGISKKEASKLLRKGTEWLAEEQSMLYVQDRWSLLLILQAIDAAGKDSTIKHVMSGVNPQGCQVFSFKQPSQEELSHDFMWRCFKCLPERGRIGIFNRSYYEEVLIVRVHPEILKLQKVPQPGIMRVSPVRMVRASADSMLRMESSAFSALPSCRNPSTALRTTTAKMIPASIHWLTIILMNPAASSTYIRMLLNCAKNRVKGSGFLPSGRRFGPYFSSRAEASDKMRPSSALVPSRSTTSARDIACQAATSLSVFVLTALPVTPLWRPEGRCQR